MKFVAIDFETANASFQSACSLGMLVFEDGVLVHSYYTLLLPDKKYRRFHWGNQLIHNISLEMVQDAPSWKEVFPIIESWFENAIIVAHNAQFDMQVLKSLNVLNGFKTTFPYLCTVEVSRMIHPSLQNHKLSTVAQYLEIELDHHNALSDAYACSMIMVDAMVKASQFDIYKLVDFLGLKLKKS